MMRKLTRIFPAAAAVVALSLLPLTPVFAQFTDLLKLGGEPSASAAADPEVVVTLTPADAQPGQDVTLAIAVKLPPDSYTYSTNPNFGGATKITITEANGLEPVGKDFQPNPRPKTVFEPLFKQDVEKHLSDVTWTRKYRILPDAKPSEVSLSGVLKYQVCDNRSCLPLNESFQAALVKGESLQADLLVSDADSQKPQPFQYEKTPTRKVRSKELPDPLKFRFALSPENAQPGATVTLSIAARLEEEWHIFALTQDPKNYGLPTRISVEGLRGLKPLDEDFSSDKKPEIATPFDDGKQQHVHHGEVTWSRKYEVLATAKPGDYGLRGKITYQICHKSCLLPLPVAFALGNAPAATARSASVHPIDKPARPVESQTTGIGLDFQPVDEEAGGSLAWYLFTAFIGGLILNVMPCVLPVIAIKVMSFVQQAGESRSRILALNVAYSVGVVAVFLILASLAVWIGLGWGGLFQNSEFNLIMACVVFAMGLSLLGVFEFPVPGFVGSAAGSQHQEGLLGAFLTGILATLLATPCSGPFLGATLGWSVRQSPAIVYLVWGVMGLGMASPYVVFGLFPAAIKWLPKPGMWMVRLKEFAGFILMGTVIFFIYFIEQAYVVPLLIILLGISLGLWMLGNLYDVNSHIRHKTAVRVTAFVLAGVISAFGYSLAQSQDEGSRLPWEDFTEHRLNASLSESKTVLVDFTADWCLTCKTNEKFALNTSETLNLVKQHGIVPLYADYTHQSEEIASWLERFDSRSVPLTVIFPGRQPNRPIVIRDLYTQGTLLEKLKMAVGASDDEADRSAAHLSTAPLIVR